MDVDGRWSDRHQVAPQVRALAAGIIVVGILGTEWLYQGEHVLGRAGRLSGYLITVALAGVAYLGGYVARQQRILDKQVSLATRSIPSALFELVVSDAGSTRVPLMLGSLPVLSGLPPHVLARDAGPLWDLFDRETREAALSSLRIAARDRSSWRARLRCVRDPEEPRWLLASASPIDGSEGHITFHGTLVDITDEVETEQRLRTLSQVFESTLNGVAIMDRDGVVLDVNQGMSDLTGVPQEEFYGRRLRDLCDGSTPKAVFDEIDHHLATDGSWRGFVFARLPTGSIRRFEMQVSTDVGDSDETTHRIAVLMARDDLYTDALTGLPTRSSLEDRLQQATLTAAEAGDEVAVVLFGLDSFHDVNSSVGAQQGDLLLQETARRLSRAAGGLRTVARIEGDQFAVVMTSLDGPMEIEQLIDDCRVALGDPIELDRPVLISASVGVAVFPEHAVSGQQLLAAATTALRSAKSSGRGSVGYATPELQSETSRRAEIAMGFGRAIQDGEMTVVFQPIADLRTGDFVKAEALVRWRHPQLGDVDSTMFVSVAESAGLMSQISDRVFEEVVHFLGEVLPFDPEFSVGVNLSPTELNMPWPWHARRFGMLADAGIPPSAVILEVTEGALLAGEGAVDVLRRLRAEGMRVAIDDFGTGYSSLAYLRDLEVDIIKVDRAFVVDLEFDHRGQRMLEAVATMARHLRLDIVIEGIEREGQRDLAVQAGCSLGQGFLYSRPVPAERLIPRIGAGI